MSRTEIMDEIRRRTTKAEQLVMLAEEATELAQAALKYHRVLTGEFPTPATEQECRANVVEEHADLQWCFQLLNWDDKRLREEILNFKTRRAAERFGIGIEAKE